MATNVQNCSRQRGSLPGPSTPTPNIQRHGSQVGDIMTLGSSPCAGSLSGLSTSSQPLLCPTFNSSEPFCSSCLQFDHWVLVSQLRVVDPLAPGDSLRLPHQLLRTLSDSPISSWRLSRTHYQLVSGDSLVPHDSLGLSISFPGLWDSLSVSVDSLGQLLIHLRAFEANTGIRSPRSHLLFMQPGQDML